MTYLAVHEPTQTSTTGPTANDAVLDLLLTVGDVHADDGILIFGPLGLTL